MEQNVFCRPPLFPEWIFHCGTVHVHSMIHRLSLPGGCATSYLNSQIKSNDLASAWCFITNTGTHRSTGTSNKNVCTKLETCTLHAKARPEVLSLPLTQRVRASQPDIQPDIRLAVSQPARASKPARAAPRTSSRNSLEISTSTENRQEICHGIHYEIHCQKIIKESIQLQQVSFKKLVVKNYLSNHICRKLGRQ